MAFGSQPTFGAPSSNPGQILAQADQLRQAGRLADAESLVRSLVQAQPNLPSALNMLGLLVRARGDNNEAEALLRRAVAAAPSEAALHNNLGNVLIAKGDTAAAESAYRKAISLKSDYPEAWNNLGIALRDQGQSEPAITAFRRALSLRSNYPQAEIQLGALLIENGDPAEALSLLERVAAMAPQSYDAQYYRGNALNKLGRFEQAIPVLQVAVELAPNRYEARYALANAFAQSGRDADALLAYQRCFECKPDFLPALYDFSALAWSLGNDVRALESYRFARSKIGDTPDLLLAEANMRMRFVGSNEAEGLLRTAHNMAPERADITNALARSLLVQSRFDESFPLFSQAIAAEPNEARHRNDLGEALLRSGEHKEAARVLEEALKLAPYDQIALAYLALAYRETGDSRYDSLMNIERFVREYEIAPPAGFTDIAGFNQALAEELEQLHTRYVAPIDQTLQNGTQTAGALFARKGRALEAVREKIREAVADYIQNLPDGADHPMLARKDSKFAFSGSWSCRLHSAGFHNNHVHNQGWISSAYYAALPDVVASGNQGQGALKFAESKFRLGERDRPGRIVQPKVGKLVLFPSYFWHGTVPFQSRDMRLTIAFDVTPGDAPKRAASGPNY